jgi:hypothetical protein
VDHEDGGATDLAVSPRLRRAVHWFLLVFALTGVAHLELWPFTAFRLFSELRPAERQGWQLVAVDEGGEEQPIHLSELPLAYRNTARLVDGFDGRSQAQRDDVCDAWAQAVRGAGGEVDFVRIYLVEASVRPDGPPPTRIPTYECGSGR